METREMEFRLVDAAKREVAGIAVPYDTVENGEMFARDSVTLDPEAKLMWQHDSKEPIGKIVDGRHTKGGFEIRATITETQRGLDAIKLLEDGVVNKFSVGFVMRDSQITEDRTRVVTDALVREVSLVSFPWYSDANVTEVREEETESEVPASAPEQEETVEEITPVASDLAEVREAITVLEREVASITKVEAPVAPAFRTVGEALKAAVSGDEQAVRLFASTSDSVTTPYDRDLVNLVDESQFGIGNFFSRGTTPATGMTIEYIKLAGTVDNTGDQAAEGDDLGYVGIEITTDSAPINTVGNHIALSRQVIERSTAPFLDSSIRFQANALAMNLHNKVVDVYQAECAAQILAGNFVNIGTKTYGEWAGALADAQALYFQPLGLTVEALIVDTATFKDLIALDGTPVVSFAGESAGTVASASARGLRGSLCGVPIIVDASLNTNGSEVAFAASSSIRQYTSGTVRLTDSDAIKLIEKASLYTYEATVLEIQAIIPAIVD